ncbi:MAG: hypothetical protein ABIQ89_04445 [Candidatus Saccharimonadales bacterium]
MPKDSTQLSQLDSQISALHQQLNQLYRRRLQTMRQQKPQLQSIDSQFNQTIQQDSNNIYNRLTDAWLSQGVDIPSLRTLSKRLQKASALNRQLTNKYPELVNHMEIVLVPPTAVLNTILDKDHNGHQQIVTQSALESINRWRVTLIYSASHGLPLESSAYTNRQKLSQLGLNEYLALIIQGQLLIDEGTWTMLLKNNQQAVVSCAGFASGAYRFIDDEINSIFNDNGFRPCVEVMA